MLQRPARHRLFQAFLIVALVIAGLATPIRHDYSTIERVVICSAPCSEESLLTEVQYGVPFVWLKLYSETSTTSNVNVPPSQQNTIAAANLFLDLGSYMVLIGLIVGILKLDKRILPHENLRH